MIVQMFSQQCKRAGLLRSDSTFRNAHVNSDLCIIFSFKDHAEDLPAFTG